MSNRMLRQVFLGSAFAFSLEAFACAPSFPVSYFPHRFLPEETEVPESVTMLVATNAAVKCVDRYCVAPHLGTELAMIGAHYYPAWAGKAPASNRVSTPQADNRDFLAAGRAAKVPPEKVQADWAAFSDFCQTVCARLERGEEVAVPQGIAGYASEFYLYKLGHAQWLVFRKDADPEPFRTLLSLPRERRLYRTVWVHFVRLANARTFAEKDRHLAAMRRALDEGFRDTAALESFVLRFLSCTCPDRFTPLVLTAYARAPWKEWPGYAKRLFLAGRVKGALSPEELEKLCADPVGVEVAVAMGAGGALPATAQRPRQPVLGADRQAWIAFHEGDFALCRKLLALAPEKSLVRLFLEARLARLDGQAEKAARFLHDWLAEYRRKDARARAALTGYGIGVSYCHFWWTGMADDPRWAFSDVVHYTGEYGPSGEYGVNVIGAFRDFPLERSHAPTMARIVAGELGVVKVATRDFEEALDAFLAARNWVDIAFVAERCLSPDELMHYLREKPLDAKVRERLVDLLVRRLMRTGRTAEACAWAAGPLKSLCLEYRALAAEAQDASAAADRRAVACFNLSRLVLTRGMELMGTELRPDVAFLDGDFAEDALPLAEPFELEERLGLPRAASRWEGWSRTADRENKRFHYRYKALAFAKAAVRLAEDADVRAWSLMLGGVAALSVNDPAEADSFYKPLAKMRHPRAKVGRWFNGPTYDWFRTTHYNKERHHKPLRVPPRMTKEQLQKMKML